MNKHDFLASLLRPRGGSRPLIVAEISGNHNGSLERALKLIDAAAEAGVDAIKLQTYTADTITLDVCRDEFLVNKPESQWHGRTLHSLYSEAHTPWEWHEALIERANNAGLAWFSSPFDPTAVEFLEAFEPPCYKIASPEIVDLPLILKCATTGRPLIVSTGMASITDIGDAVGAARQAGCKSITLLKCTTDYPANPQDANIRTIPHLAQTFDCHVGLSDHTLGVGVAVAAVALGASMIEKHLTLSREDGGPDSHFSLDPSEMKKLVSECRDAWLSLGAVKYGPTDSERDYLVARRSLYITADMKAGDVFSDANIRSVRPGLGLPPKYLNIVLGRKINVTVPGGTPLSWSVIS